MKRIISAMMMAIMLFGVVGLGSEAFRISYATDCIASQCSMVKSGLFGKDITFSEVDFKQALCVTGFESVTICKLPPKEEGVLKLAGVAVSEGQVISRANIEKLTFTPASQTVEGSSFVFTCEECGSGSELTCQIRFTDKINAAPTTQGISDTSLHVWTQKNMTVFGSMAASDPENDELTFMVVRYPEKGTLEVTNTTFGDFRYTPKPRFRGTDSFVYVVRDSFGNYSVPTTVTIHVKRGEIDITYTDMDEHSASYAASVMTANHIMQGSIRGDGYYFDPDLSVSKQEFVVMAMKVLGIAPRAEAKATFFDDDQSISPEMKSYIATACQYGYISGTFVDNKLLFSPEEAISRAEAAVIVSNMMSGSLATSCAIEPTDSEDIPTWAKSSMLTLYQNGLLARTEGGQLSPKEDLTRGQAASLFLAMMQYQDSIVGVSK